MRILSEIKFTEAKMKQNRTVNNSSVCFVKVMLSSCESAAMRSTHSRTNDTPGGEMHQLSVVIKQIQMTNEEVFYFCGIKCETKASMN